MKRDLTELALALAIHRMERGRYPATLDELVPQCLPVIPPDRFTDRPLIYRPSASGFVLYSVGPNLVDDGGKDDLKDVVVRIDAPATQPAK